tara:strand:- start:192 stop:467 length:276 start_codon:yes stop_codon:yes gene_type:complete
MLMLTSAKWDWAMRKPDWHFPNDRRRDGPNVPFIITVPTVEVMTKTGVATVSNPMWKYRLPNGASFGDFGITRDDTLPVGLPILPLRSPSY